MTLPTLARTKLNQLEQQSSDARALAQSAYDARQLAEARVAEARRELYTMPSDDRRRSQVQEKIEECERAAETAKQTQKQRQESYHHISRVVTQCVAFLDRNHQANFEVASAKPSKSAKLDSVRQAILKIKADLVKAKQTPLDVDTLKQHAVELVQEFADRGKPTLSNLTDRLHLTPPDGPPRPWHVAAWIDPGAFIKALHRDIDALPAGGMSAKARAEKIARLEASLDELERQEESLVVRDGGVSRTDASPLAILGIRRASHKIAAA